MSPGVSASGAWRPDLPFNGNDGLKVTLRREPGVTPSGYLKVPFRFQVGPTDSYTRRWEYDWTTDRTVVAGERAREGGPLLERVTFATMFLDEELQFMVWTGTLDAQRLLDELRALLTAPAPFRLIVAQPALWGPRPITNIVAAFTSISPEERGGEVGTEYTGVEFLEVPRQRLQQTGRARPSAASQPRRYTLRKGDTLYGVALKVYKRKSGWREIAAANGIRGVSPDDADELAAWAKHHRRTTLRVPAEQWVGAKTLVSTHLS